MAKTLKLKRPGSDAPKDSENESAAEAPIPSRFQPPPTDDAAPRASYKIAGTLAILASILFLALVAVQLLEAAYYQSPPSVWPRAKTLGLF